MLNVNRISRGDHIIIGSALILLVGLYAGYWHDAYRGAQASVLVGGEHWLNVDLSYDQTINVPGAIGVSKLLINDGKIRFIESPCDGKQCIYQGWISQGGEIAACLPNKLSVQILSRDPRFDSINF